MALPLVLGTLLIGPVDCGVLVSVLGAHSFSRLPNSFDSASAVARDAFKSSFIVWNSILLP